MAALYVARRFWARKGLVALAVPVAILLALLVEYKVTASPPFLEEPDSSYGVASVQLFIDSDSPSSITDSSVTPQALGSRSQIYAALGASAQVQSLASRLAGVPNGSFSISAQAASTRPGRASGSSTAGLAGGVPAVTIQGSGGSPLLQVRSQAPTRELAARIANGTAAALRRTVKASGDRQGVSSEDRIVIRQFGQARSTLESQNVSKGTVVQVGIIAWILLVFAILGVDFLIRQARRERHELAQDRGRDPGVVSR